MDLIRIASRVAAGLTYKVNCEEVPFGAPQLKQSVGTVTLVRSDGAKVVGTYSGGEWSKVTNETDLSDGEAASLLAKAREKFPQGGGGNWDDIAG